MSEGMTLWFDKDIREIKENPHRIETPFGFAAIVGTGNAFDQRDALEEAIESALSLMDEDHPAYSILLKAGRE